MPRAPRNDATPPKFGLSLLGGFELTGPDGVVDLSGGKLAGLLAYLACTAPKPQPRERLSTLLWGSHFDLQAKQNLRQALSRLRKLLGPDALGGDGDVVWLNPSAVQCDVSRFETLVREGSRDALSAAADLYRGRLIDDIATSEEGWNEWLTVERERLQELALGAMVRLGELELAAGRGEQALKAGRRAVALNNMREDAHRLIVQSLAATGRKAEALRHYQDLAALLKRELSTEPAAATRALAAGLRTAEPPSAPPAAKEIARSQPPPGPSQSSAALSPASSTAAIRPDGAERRLLTIMACNMVDAIASWARPDPEDMHELVGAFHKAIDDVVARFDGFVAQHLGDGVLVYFGYPVAREHDTDQALRAGLAILDAVGALRVSPGVPLQARAGIATGLVVVGEQSAGGDAGQRIAIGETSQLATRLQATAAPGQLVIEAVTHRLVGRMFDCRALAGNEAKGLPQSVEAWRVLGETAGVNRFEARRSGPALPPLVGRLEEMDLLLRRWDQAKRGEGRVVLLSGEAGIGKSCIVENLSARLAGEPHARLRYFCSPHHVQSALYPFIVQLERAAGFAADSTIEAKLGKLEALLSPTANNATRDVALIAELLGLPVAGRDPVLTLDSLRKREMTLTALLDQVEGMAARAPVLIVCEDIHWIDPTSQDLLERAVALIIELPVLMVITARPEVALAFADQPHVNTLSLSRFGRNDSVRIVGGIVGDKALPETVLERIVSQADGVPMFLEEITQTLLDGGLMRPTADRYVLDGPLPSLAIPTTLQASLVARLDRLGPGRELATIGAAIGREFSHELIAAVSGLAAADLDAALGRLTASGLASRRGTPPDATYVFRHALIQDAAYATLLRSRRRELHAGIAKVLVDRFPQTAERQPEFVARHFAEAGLAGEAIDHWLKAFRRAVSRSAYREASTSIEQALVLLEALPESRETMEQAIDLRFELKSVLIALGEFERQLFCLQQAERLARRLDDKSRLGWARVHFCHVYWMTGRVAKALASGEEGLALAQTVGDSRLKTWASLQLGAACVFSGDYLRGEQLLESLPVHRELTEATYDAILVHTYLSGIFEGQGKFPQSIEHGDEGIRLAEARGTPQLLANAILFSAMSASAQGDFARAIGLAERILALCRKWNLTMMSASAKAMLGQAYALSGRVAEGVPMLEEGVTAMATMRHGGGIALFQLYLGQAYLAAGRIADARAVGEKALAVAREGGQRGIEGRAHCFLGEIALHQDRHDQAERCFLDALALAEACGSPPLAAHCHFGYATLYRSAGAERQARDHLATATAIYRAMGMTYWLERVEGT